MKKGPFCLALVFLCASLCCSSQDMIDEGRTLAKINDYNLSVSRFQYQLAKELEMDEDFKLTHEAKREFLEEIIKKELLLQEAKRLKLDRKQEFVKAMERYWESTLIRDLIDLKSKEIDKRAYTSEEEIDIRCKEMKKSKGNLPPIKVVREKIGNELKEEKKTRMFKEWISDLRKNAKIEIDEELL